MEQCPDMIVFTGDLVSTEANELDGFDEILSRLHAPDGVYSILGNHDYLTYAYYLSPEEQAAQREELKKRQRAMNWDLLLNEHRIIRQGRDSIALVGVENDGKPPFPERGDLKKGFGRNPRVRARQRLDAYVQSVAQPRPDPLAAQGIAANRHPAHVVGTYPRHAVYAFRLVALQILLS